MDKSCENCGWGKSMHCFGCWDYAHWQSKVEQSDKDCLKCVNFSSKGATPEDDEYPCYTCEKWSNYEPKPEIIPPNKAWVKQWVDMRYNELNIDMQKLLVSVMGYCLWRTKQTKRYGGKKNVIQKNNIQTF